MRLSGTRAQTINQYCGLGNQLYDLAGTRPSLDLTFADSKSLVDATTGRNLVTFTRASSGTYVDSQGVIRTATTNLLLRSEELDDAYWTKNNLQAFGSGSIANAIAAPNGTITADKIVENTVNAQHMVFRGITPEGGLRYTLSFYAKAAERSFVIGAFSGGGLASDCTVGINLTNGSVVSTSNIPDIATATLVGDGWYRVVLSKTLPSSTSVQPRIIISTNGTTQGYTGDGTSGIYLWGAQLEQSSTVGEYIPTTSTINSAPRFDHNPTTGESLGLLVEEARTNLLLRSEEFDGASWTKTRSNVTANAITAPNGTLTGDKLIDSTDASASHFISQSISFVSGTTYTTSIFAKQGEIRYLRLGFNAAPFGTTQVVFFDLLNGAVSSNPNALAASITNAGDNWWRLAVTATATSTASDLILINLSSNGTSSSFTGDGTSGLYIWGAQLEAGAFPTSYIPTTTATVTRSADVASITGSNFSSWYRQDEGTFFWSGSIYNTQYSNQNAFRVTEGTNLRGIGFGLDGRTGSDDAYFSTRNNTNITSASSSFPYVIGNSNIRIGGAFGTDVAASFNGSAPVVSSPAYIFGTENQIEIMGSKAISGTNFQYNGYTRRLTYFPVRLANETLQRITQ